MNWLDTSIMRTRGVAQGRTPDTHALTEATQGKFHYTIGPYSDPVLHVRPGDRVVVDTRDAFEGAVKTEQDLPSKVLKMPFVNPQNGPIIIEGAKPGDAIDVSYFLPDSGRALIEGTNRFRVRAVVPMSGPLYFTSMVSRASPISGAVARISRRFLVKVSFTPDTESLTSWEVRRTAVRSVSRSIATRSPLACGITWRKFG
jgi:hypothetical protein